MVEYFEQQMLKDQTTANSYADGAAIDIKAVGYGKALIWVKNKHGANSAKVKILAAQALHGDWEEVLSETTLAAGATIKHTSSDPWARYKIQHKSAIADTPATLDAYISAK